MDPSYPLQGVILNRRRRVEEERVAMLCDVVTTVVFVLLSASCEMKFFNQEWYTGFLCLFQEEESEMGGLDFFGFVSFPFKSTLLFGGVVLCFCFVPRQCTRDSSTTTPDPTDSVFP